MLLPLKFNNIIDIVKLVQLLARHHTTETVIPLIKILSCGCGYVAIFDIVENCEQMPLMRPQL